jgi:hypothetical protein
VYYSRRNSERAELSIGEKQDRFMKVSQIRSFAEIPHFFTSIGGILGNAADSWVEYTQTLVV